MDKLLWSEDCDKVYALLSAFKNEKEFRIAVQETYRCWTGKKCELFNFKIETCISTEKGISAESVIPLNLTDIEISNYYIADVEEVED
jgi:hypothetical protein